MIFGPLFMILVLAVTVAIIVLLVRWLGGPGREPHRRIPDRRAFGRSTSSKSAMREGRSTRTSSMSAAACSASDRSGQARRLASVKILFIPNDPLWQRALLQRVPRQPCPSAIPKHTFLISVMHANNGVDTIPPPPSSGGRIPRADLLGAGAIAM